MVRLDLEGDTIVRAEWGVRLWYGLGRLSTSLVFVSKRKVILLRGCEVGLDIRPGKKYIVP